MKQSQLLPAASEDISIQRNMGLKHQTQTELPWDSAHIDDRYPVCITMDYLPNNRAKGDLCFLERCSLLCWIISMHPSLLAAFHFGIKSLQYPSHLSVGCMPLYSTRYIDKGNLLCKVVKLTHTKSGNCSRIFLDRHTRTCYNRTFHVLKILKLRLC